MAPVELFVPYSEGARLHDLHEVAGRIDREDEADGVRVRTRLPAGQMHRFDDLTVPRPEGRAAGSGERVECRQWSSGFQILSEAAILPSRAHEGDAGLDLHSAQNAHIGPGERWQISTGLAVEIPEGHAGLVSAAIRQCAALRDLAGQRAGPDRRRLPR